MEHVDTLIHARWIIPVEPDNTVHEHHSLAIKDGRIHAIAWRTSRSVTPEHEQMIIGEGP